MASRAKGSLTATAATVDALVSAIVTGGIEYDDVVKALNFDKVQFVDFLDCIFFILLIFIFTIILFTFCPHNVYFYQAVDGGGGGANGSGVGMSEAAREVINRPFSNLNFYFDITI